MKRSQSSLLSMRGVGVRTFVIQVLRALTKLRFSGMRAEWWIRVHSPVLHWRAYHFKAGWFQTCRDFWFRALQVQWFPHPQ